MGWWVQLPLFLPLPTLHHTIFSFKTDKLKLSTALVHHLKAYKSGFGHSCNSFIFFFCLTSGITRIQQPFSCYVAPLVIVSLQSTDSSLF